MGKKKSSVKSYEFEPLGQKAHKNYEKSLFQPSSEIRLLDLEGLIGQTLQVQLGPANKDNTDQSMTLNEEQIRRLVGLRLFMSGWLGKFVGKPFSLVKFSVSDAYLLGFGGKKAKTYSELFDGEQRKVLCEQWEKQGDDGKLTQAKVVVVFGNGLKIEASTWGLKAPEEWYSEYLREHNKLKIKGFFETPEAALNYFLKDSHTGQGEARFLPVGVFPLKVKPHIIQEITSGTIRHSTPVLMEDRVAIGMRCKPNQLSKTISSVYEEGGRVAQGSLWDW